MSNDRQVGITRDLAAKGFVYRDPSGAIINDRDEVARINSIALSRHLLSTVGINVVVVGAASVD